MYYTLYRVRNILIFQIKKQFKILSQLKKAGLYNFKIQ